MTIVTRQINRIVIHHSASPRSTTLADIEGWHNAIGYSGIGYNYVIEDDGACLVGRSIGRQGAHCSADGANKDSIGICVTGNNTVEVDKWNREQTLALVELLDTLFAEWGPLKVMGHRDVPGAKTLCPGLDVLLYLHKFVSEGEPSVQDE